MRGRSLVMILCLGCGSPASPPETTQVAAPPPQETWTAVVPGRLEVSVRAEVAPHGSETGVVFRLTNHGDEPVLADLRSLDRVVRTGPDGALRLPLTEAQVAELSMISALTQVAAGTSVAYAVPIAACDATAPTPIGGRLVALDGPRTIELVADGASVRLRCDPVPLPARTVWVAGSTPLVAADRDPGSFGAELPPLIQAASVSAAAEIALLPFSYDARPIERWRYDACVAAGTCPARAVAQPPGSIGAPAVGMAQAGVDAFCASRSLGGRALRALTTQELDAVADPGRAILSDAPAEVVRAGFRCARSDGAP